MGFGGVGRNAGRLQDQGQLLARVETDDILKYGMIPELIGRFPILTALEPLDDEAYIKILTEPRNALVKQYQKLVELHGTKLAFDPGALRALARKARTKGTGARALRTVMEELMLDVMFELPSRKDVRKLDISGEMVEQGGPSVMAALPKPARKSAAAKSRSPSRPSTSKRRESA